MMLTALASVLKAQTVAADTTLFGSVTKVREGIEAWFDAGIRTPIIVPSSAQGNQMNALQEFFDIWD